MALGDEAKLRAELVETLYRQKPTVLFVGILNAAIVTFVVWGVTPHPWPAVWLIAICAVALARLVPLWWYRRQPASARNTQAWAGLFAASAAANGIVWGASGVLFFTPDLVLYQVFLAFVIGGMCAGAAAALSTYMPAFYAFLAPSMLPLVIRLWIEGGIVPTAMGLLLVLFCGGMAMLARNLGAAVVGSTKLRLEKEALLEERTQHQRTLEREIADRTADLRRVNEELHAEIAERQQTEGELRESQERIQRAIRAGSVAPWEFRFDTGEIKYAPSTSVILGEDVGNMSTPEAWSRRVPPEDFAALMAAAQACAQGERSEIDFEHRLLGKEGAERWVVTRASVILDDEGRPVALSGTTTDITTRKTAEQSAQDSRTRLEGILAAAGDGILSVNQRGGIEDANPAAARMFGYPTEQLIGTSVVQLVPSEDRDRLAHMLSDYARTGEARMTGRGPREWRAQKRDGSVFPIEVVVEAMKLGADPGFVVIARDVTERKRAQEALRDTEGRLSAVATAAPLVLWAVDRKGTITLREGKGLETLGPGAADQVGESVFDLYRDFPQVTRNVRRALAGEEFTDVLDFGDSVFTDSYHPVRDANGKITGAMGVGIDVTSRTRAEEALRETEALLSAVASNAPIILWAVDCEGIYTLLEGKGLEAMGRNAGEAVGQSVFDEFREFPEITANVRRALAGETFVTTDAFSDRVLESMYGPLRDDAGEVVGASGVAVDITMRKRAEGALRDSDALLGTVANNAPIVLWAVDRDGVYTLSEGSGLASLGRVPGQVVGQSIFDVYRDVPLIGESVRRALEGESFQTTISIGRHEFEGFYAPLCDEDGEIEGAMGVAVDVTARMEAERARHESEARYRMLFEQAPVMMHSIDRQARLLDVNGVWLETMGRTREEVEGRPVTDFMTPESRAYAESVALPRFLEAGQVVDVPYEFVAKNGETVDVLVSALSERDPEGEVIRSVAVLIDVTERRRIEAERRDTQFLLRAMTEGATDGIFIKDLEGRYRMFNASCAILHHLDAETIVGKDDTAIFPVELARKIMADDRNILAARETTTVEENVEVDGEPRVFRTTKGPCEDADGRLVGLIGVTRDITEQKRAEDALRVARVELEKRVRERTGDLARVNTSLRQEIDERGRAEEALIVAKNEAELANRAKSEFLANTSHELRTPLNAVIGFADMLGGGYAGTLNTRQADYVSDIRDSGAALLELINDILDLSKIESGKVQVDEEDVDVSRAVRATVRLVKERAHTAQLRLRTNMADDLPLLRVDERMVKRIMLNLLTNAVKFTPAGGEVDVDAFVAKDGAFCLVVKDTGIGIATENQSLVMAPFGQVDSKLNRRYRGTGLGLPLVKSMSEAHGGGVQLESGAGAGTTVTVRFPKDRVIAGFVPAAAGPASA